MKRIATLAVPTFVGFFATTAAIAAFPWLFPLGMFLAWGVFRFHDPTCAALTAAVVGGPVVTVLSLLVLADMAFVHIDDEGRGWGRLGTVLLAGLAAGLVTAVARGDIRILPYVLVPAVLPGAALVLGWPRRLGRTALLLAPFLVPLGAAPALLWWGAAFDCMGYP